MRTSLPNIHSETGYRYGVVNASACPDLLDIILQDGVNTTETDTVDHVRCSVEDQLADFDASSGYDDLHQRFIALGREFDVDVDMLEREVGVSQHELVFDIAEVSRYIINQVLDERDCSEDDYTLYTQDAHYLVHYLGGAPLITVVWSEYVTDAAPCSPCCPNAGDLDSDGGSLVTYCPPPVFYCKLQSRRVDNA